MSEDTRVFDTGAKRSSDVDHLAYDKVSPIGLRRLAVRYAHGMVTYGPWNYLLGIPASNIISHMIAHVEKYRAGDRTDDHLAAIAWGAFTLMHYEETRPHLMDVESYPLRSVTAEGEKMTYPAEGKEEPTCMRKPITFTDRLPKLKDVALLNPMIWCCKCQQEMTQGVGYSKCEICDYKLVTNYESTDKEI